MKPPKCKSCGKEEWRHVCGPGARQSGIKAIEPLGKGASAKKLRRGDGIDNVGGERPSPAASAAYVPLHSAKPKPIPPGAIIFPAGAVSPEPATLIAMRPKPKVDRKAYLAQKARERRARQKTKGALP